MPPPMVPAPMTPTLLTGSGAVSSATSGTLVVSRSAKKMWRWAADCVPGDQLHEQLALDLQPLAEGQVHRRLDRLDAGLGRLEALELAGVGLAEVVEDLGLAAGGLDLVVALADPADRPALGDHLAGEGDGALAQLALLDQLVDQPAHGGHLGVDHHARGDDLQAPAPARRCAAAAGCRRRRAAGRASPPAGRAWRRGRRRGSGEPSATSSPPPSAVPWMAAITGLPTASISSTSSGSMRQLRRLAELGDVGAGDEGAARADQHDGLDRVVGGRGARPRAGCPGARRRTAR